MNISHPSLTEEKEQLIFAPENDAIIFAPEDDQLVFASEDGQTVFAPEDDENNTIHSWQVLIVDDEIEVHNITKLLLKNFSFESKKVSCLSAYSGEEARQIIAKNSDIALILLDVVMETDDAGLQFVKYVREDLNNDTVQIILRTGQPGQVPEMVIVENYHINDYKTKTELTKPKLFTTIRTALRTFSSLYKLHFEIQHREQVEAQLRLSEAKERTKSQQLELALEELKQTQLQLIQSEKMSALGQLVAGIAHETNNPINFIHGNLTHATRYIQDLLKLIELYQEYYPHPVAEIQDELAEIDLDFLTKDLTKMLASMQLGTKRITKMVKSLRTFSRLDEAEIKEVNINDGIDSALMILHRRLKTTSERPEIQVIKEYGQLPLIECYPGQLNQVFMNILANAIDILEETHQERSFAGMKENFGTIKISTEVVNGEWIAIRIADNGKGLDEILSKKLFEPFFTTKPVGKGTGLGLSISYQIIVELHGGKIHCDSVPGKGTEFVLEIPLRQPTP